MENDAFDAFDTSGEPDATTVTVGQEHEAASQKEQMMRQLEVGGKKPVRERSQSCHVAASGNVTVGPHGPQGQFV